MPTLDWIGKRAVINNHLTVPYHLLKGEEAFSAGEAGSGNLLVQGDNLLALKALLPYYAGQVKCIYIDPPYNTGNESWVYNDNNNAPEIKTWLGRAVGKEAEDLSRHDKWLCMMYTRLQLLRQLLREDGAIFVSIDDNEVGNLRPVMDEIFGDRNFVCTFVWEKKHTRANDAQFVSDNHDFILFYAKDRDRLKMNRLPRSEAANARFENPDNDPRGVWISQPLQVKTPSESYIYEIVTPTGRKIRPPEGRSWAFGQARYEELVADGRIYFGATGANVPRLKKFLTDVADLVPVTIWPRTEVGDNQEAKSEIKAILEGLPISFDSPKPSRLIERVLQLASDKSSIVLDSFAGSGSTGHAVIKLNAADNGNRRFILVEMQENIARNITAERLKRVTNGYGDTPGLGGGFRFATLGEPLFDEHGQISDAVRFADLARHVYFSETGEPHPQTTNGKTPLIGACGRTAYYLLFNGILGDKTAAGGNVLTDKILRQLPAHPMGSDNPRVIFGEGCRLGTARLEREGIIFKQLPYEIKVN